MNIDAVKEMYNMLSPEEKKEFINSITNNPPTLNDTERYIDYIKTYAKLSDIAYDYDIGQSVSEQDYENAVKKLDDIDKSFEETFGVDSVENEAWITISRFDFKTVVELSKKLDYQITEDELIKDAIKVLKTVAYNCDNYQIGRMHAIKCIFPEEKRPIYFKLLYAIESSDNSY